MKTYYLFNEGRMSRRENTLKFVPRDKEGKEEKPRFMPIENTANLYIFGSLDVNSALLNFLGKNRISLHFFDYYEHYTGSFMPKDYLLAGKMQIQQTEHYLKPKKRIDIAKALLQGASFNILKNLKYYNNRGKDCQKQIDKIETLSQSFTHSQSTQLPVQSIQELMGIEGNIRQTYYETFETIINDFEMGNREKQPPSNEVNALISFGNMVCYTLCLDQIYHTQLNPTVSFLQKKFSIISKILLDN